MNQILFPKHEYEDLLKRLHEAAGTGLDLSPGDKLCGEAAKAVEDLLERRRRHVAETGRSAEAGKGSGGEAGAS